MAYVYAVCAVHVTIFSTDVNSIQFQILELHALTLAARSYVLLLVLCLECCAYAYTHTQELSICGQ